MLAGEFFLSVIFILAVISLISVLFTDKKLVFGIAGLGFLLAFYFLGKNFDMVESLPLVAFIMGVSLIALEIFIPSFGIIGISGIIIGGYGLINIIRAGKDEIFLMVLAAVTIVVSVIIYVKLGFKVNIFSKGILSTTNSKARGYNSKIDYSYLLGKEGVSSSILRPTGRVEIEGKYYDALSRGNFIKEGKRVVVVDVKDGNVIVKEK
ncbi:MAG: NfeD family protein [Anaerococcus sp.]|nr:NfeD family protein [Anaerococcus sp.]